MNETVEFAQTLFTSLVSNIIYYFAKPLWDLFLVSVTISIPSYLGYLYYIARFKYEKRIAFYKKQLNEFYSPLVSCLMNIRALSDLRVRIYNAERIVWENQCDEMRQKNDLMEFCAESTEQFKPYENSIDYDNMQFKEKIFPLYNQMLSIFTEKYWLADEETQKFYSDLVEFIEIWHRVNSKSIHLRVVTHIGHTEEKLNPFYTNLEEKMNNLKKIIACDNT